MKIVLNMKLLLLRNDFQNEEKCFKNKLSTFVTLIVKIRFRYKKTS